MFETTPILIGSLSMGAGLSQFNSWIESQLSSSENVFWILGLMLLGGLAASLLPCVYPLYPATVSILKKRGAESGGATHALIYYLGLCSIYAAFGIIATATGGAFNTVLSFGVTNLIIGIVFVILGLSTMGLVYLSLFEPRNLGQSDGFVGTYLMGLSAGLLSSACVGPVVVTVLISLAASVQEGFQLTVVLKGMTQMLFFGMGLGIPFLAIGLFGLRLPKSGVWMVWVQYLLALIIFYFAYIYFEKALLIYGFEPSDVPRIIGLSCVLGLTAYFFQDTSVAQTLRVRRSICTLVLFASLVALNQSMGSRLVPALAESSSAKGTSAEDLVEMDGDLKWHLGREEAYRLAKMQSKNVFIDFYGDWCTNCKAFAKLTQTDKDLNEALQSAVLLKVYDTSPQFTEYKEDDRFPELRVGLPFFVITNPDGDLLYKTNDYLKAEEMSLFLE
jgi:thiol:disulfide interchange protein DsbD